MRAHGLSGPSGLRFVDLPDPPAPAGPPRVRLAVHAAGVGFVDTLLTRGLYQRTPTLPFIPGLEVCGEVLEAPGGCGYAVGDRVAGHVMTGGFADTAWVLPELLAPLPGELSPVQGAAMVVNHHTALVALADRALLRPGESVLVHGAGGGLGGATVQLAAALGASVVAVAGTPERRELAARAGAGTVCGPDEWFDAVRDAGGVDVIVDPVGGEVFERSVRCLASGGRLVSVGFASGLIATAKANRLLLRSASVLGISWAEMLDRDATLFARTAKHLADLVHAGLRPLVTGTYDLADGASALHAIEERTSTGKLVLTTR
ncbi:MAG TPA: NADPH:quinone oxidoreductase family protein [Pseudonocardia sp.]